MKINKFLAAGVAVSVLLCGCGSTSSSSDTENEFYEDFFSSEQQESTSYEEITYDYYCAADLVGEALADINAAGFDYDTIFSLADYNVETAKPYTILIDETCAFAAGVICKGDAVIMDGIDTSVTMHDLDPDFDIENQLCWSAAFQAHYNKRIITTSDGEKFNLRYMWRPQDPEKIFYVDTEVPSDCTFIYQDSYVYLPQYDFMWFNWGDSIYDVQSSLIDKGFKLKESSYYSNCLTTNSVSEQLYGHEFYEEIYYNDNMQLTGGKYCVYTSYSEIADVFELAVKDVIAKYGDTYDLYLTNQFKSLDEMLEYMRETDYIDPYNFKAQLKWNVNGHTAIFVTIHSLDVEIEYKSIESTGGTGYTEDSLI